MDRSYVGPVRLLALEIAISLVLVGCGGGDDNPGVSNATPAAASGTTPATTQQLALSVATCGATDHKETGLQGQIPMSERAAGFKGFNCNLQLVGNAHSKRGDAWVNQFQLVRDRAGHTCGYGAPFSFTGIQGTSVVDLTDPSNPVETTVLITPGMLGPGEGIRVSQARGILVGAYYSYDTSDAHTALDVYDVSTDCRTPQLLASDTTSTFDTAGIVQMDSTGGTLGAKTSVAGHEGALSRDGLTYYIGDVAHNVYHAMDITDPTKPKLLSTFQLPSYKVLGNFAWNAGVHGLSLNNDGSRAYVTSTAFNSAVGATPLTGEWTNGFAVLDTSAIQARLPGAKMRFIVDKLDHDGGLAQMTIPVTISGKPYLITTDELGSGQATAKGNKIACDAGRTPYGMAKIFNIEDEANPTLVNKLVLEVNNPKNCGLISPDIVATDQESYDVHMCAVDNRADATTLACAYYNSGIRVYDIRDPAHVKEIAYYNPAPLDPKNPVANTCAAIPFLDASKGMVYSVCGDTGVLALKFTNGVWPFPNVKTPADEQI